MSIADAKRYSRAFACLLTPFDERLRRESRRSEFRLAERLLNDARDASYWRVLASGDKIDPTVRESIRSLAEWRVTGYEPQPIEDFMGLIDQILRPGNTRPQNDEFDQKAQAALAAFRLLLTGQP